MIMFVNAYNVFLNIYNVALVFIMDNATRKLHTGLETVKDFFILP
jgi:hypothetical protein